MTPSGVGLCPAMGLCMWMSVWNFTGCGVPCSLSTAFLWGHTSLRWSKCVLSVDSLEHDRVAVEVDELVGEMGVKAV
jgi:hypothetical protein